MTAGTYIQAVLALLIVIGLIAGLAWVLRRTGGLAFAGGGLRSADRRLKVVETLPLGARHRAVLIRRDDVEHLVVLGQSGEVVVERGITPPRQHMSADGEAQT